MIALSLLTAPAAAQVQRSSQGELLLDSTAAYRHEFGFEVEAGDLDGDGLDDLVVLGWDRVVVYRGSPNGLLPWTTIDVNGTGGVVAAPLVVGDFDGDTRDEFVVGSPFWSGVADRAGQAILFDWLEILGSPTFASSVLTATEPAAEEHFGAVLASGDFDGDGIEDLAVGVPNRDASLGSPPVKVEDSGEVDVFYGSGGLGSTPDLSFGPMDFDGAVQEDEYYGIALAAGDLNGDSYDELAVGSTRWDASSELGPIQDVGRVLIHRGTPSGLSVSASAGGWAPRQLVSDGDLLGAAGGTEVGVPFTDYGRSLAIGDFDFSLSCFPFNCFNDLAVGAPTAALTGIPDNGHGAVAIYPGSSVDLVSEGSAYSLDQRDAPGSDPEDDDWFGDTLRAGDFDGAPGADLAVGTRREDSERGIVQFFYGGATGLGSATALTHASGPAAPRSPGDLFGASIVQGRFRGSGSPDVAIGIPGRDDGVASEAGAVEVIYGCLFCDGFESGDVSHWG